MTRSAILALFITTPAWAGEVTFREDATGVIVTYHNELTMWAEVSEQTYRFQSSRGEVVFQLTRTPNDRCAIPCPDFLRCHRDAAGHRGRPAERVASRGGDHGAARHRVYRTLKGDAMRALLPLLFLASPAIADPLCVEERGMLTGGLGAPISEGGYEESQVAVMLDAERGLMVEMFANAKTGSWTLLSVAPTGRTCMEAQGIGWQAFPYRPAGDPA